MSLVQMEFSAGEFHRVLDGLDRWFDSSTSKKNWRYIKSGNLVKVDVFSENDGLINFLQNLGLSALRVNLVQDEPTEPAQARLQFSYQSKDHLRELRQLLLYDIFHLYGIASDGLYYSESETSVYLKHPAIENRFMIQPIMAAFANEQGVVLEQTP